MRTHCILLCCVYFIYFIWNRRDQPFIFIIRFQKSIYFLPLMCLSFKSMCNQWNPMYLCRSDCVYDDSYNRLWKRRMGCLYIVNNCCDDRNSAKQWPNQRALNFNITTIPVHNIRIYITCVHYNMQLSFLNYADVFAYESIVNYANVTETCSTSLLIAIMFLVIYE